MSGLPPRLRGATSSRSGKQGVFTGRVESLSGRPPGGLAAAELLPIRVIVHQERNGVKSYSGDGRPACAGRPQADPESRAFLREE